MATKESTKKTATRKARKKATHKTVVKKTTKKAVAKKTAKKAVAKKTAKKAVATKTAKKAVAKKAVAKKTAKKAVAKKAVASKTTAKQATKKSKTAKVVDDAIALPAKRLLDEPVALPGRRLTEEAIALPGKRFRAAPSTEAAVTLVPEDDVGDAFDEAVGTAFSSMFLPVNTALARSGGAAASFEPGDPSEDLAQACAALALEKKAEDVVVLRVAELTSYADFFVIAQAPSDRQVQAIARNVTEELKRRGKAPMSVDGLEQGNWVIVDYGSVVLHVFLSSARSYYDLDGFWVDAPRIAVDEGRGQGALAAMA